MAITILESAGQRSRTQQTSELGTGSRLEFFDSGRTTGNRNLDRCAISLTSRFVFADDTAGTDRKTTGETELWTNDLHLLAAAHFGSRAQCLNGSLQLDHLRGARLAAICLSTHSVRS